MKKISVFVGSLRKESYHKKLFELYQPLFDNSFTFYEIPTTDFPLYNADLESSKNEIIQVHAEHIRSSSGIIFFSPEYNYSIPGHLKNAIDWLSRIPNQPFYGKKAAIIGGSPGAIGTARMQYDLRKIGVFLNITFMNSPEVMISKMYDKFDGQHNLTDQQTKDFLKAHAQAFFEFIQ